MYKHLDIDNFDLYTIIDLIKSEIDGEPNPNLFLNSFDHLIIDAMRIINDPKNYVGTPDASNFASKIYCEKEIINFLKDFKSFDNYSIQDLRTLHNLLIKIYNYCDPIIY